MLSFNAHTSPFTTIWSFQTSAQRSGATWDSNKLGDLVYVSKTICWSLFNRKYPIIKSSICTELTGRTACQSSFCTSHARNPPFSPPLILIEFYCSFALPHWNLMKKDPASSQGKMVPRLFSSVMKLLLTSSLAFPLLCSVSEHCSPYCPAKSQV